VGATAPIGEGTSEPYDIVIRGGSVLDGTGAAAARADMPIRDGRVVSIGLLSPSILTHHTLDATGLTVAPGFIDVHSHAAEGLAGRLGEAPPLLALGVTTVFINP